jgi:hypothetical protein
MPNPLLSVRIPPDLLQQIDARAAEEGGDRSKVAIAALEHYLNPSDDSPEAATVGGSGHKAGGGPTGPSRTVIKHPLSQRR